MSEPQLRCLLCDLLLADEKARDQPTETCNQCGRKVLAGQTGGEVGLQPLNPPPKTKPPALDLELLPEAAVVPAADDIPSVPVLTKATRVEADVPTVQPRGKVTTDPADVPYAAKRVGEAPVARTGPAFPVSPPAPKPAPPFPARKSSLPDPTRTTSATPRPKVLQAFAILGCMTFLAVAAIVVIVSCVVIGLMKASKLG